MAKPNSPAGEAEKGGRAALTRWAKLTWDDLERWAGSGSVSRGRSYQRGGRVKDLKVTGDGGLMATVIGTERYATMVTLDKGRKDRALESACTCPVGYSCKHAIAAVAEYLQAVADGRDVPVAAGDDPRWAQLESGDAGDDGNWDDEDDDGDDEYVPPPRAGSSARASRSGGVSKDWDEKIEGHLRAKSQAELADLVWSLTRRFPEVYEELRERLALQEGDVGRLRAEARAEIRRVTSEQGWRNHWDGEGYTPDYTKIQHRLERLLELGHPDEVVSLGRIFLREGLRQVSESHDEGETASAFSESVAVVFQAVARSSLAAPERLLFAIDAVHEDGNDTLGEAVAAVLDAPAAPEDWSIVADTLAGRLEADPAGAKSGGDSYSRNYRRDGATGWIVEALQNAGRIEEVGALYESEARVTGSYERLVRFLLEERRFEDAERWAREGIAATVANSPGIASQLASSLCEIARNRKQWEVVAAHVARPFFDRPDVSNFDELMKAAAKAGVEGPVRAAALRFLETGVGPFRFVAARTTAVKPRPASGRRAASPPAPPSVAPGRVVVDPAWPLPMPDYLEPLLTRPRPYDPGPRPHPQVLLDMAIAAKDPHEVLRRFDAMRADGARPGSYNLAPANADRVAEAVVAAYPERAIEVYRVGLDAQLPHANQSAYDSAARYLKKLRPIYEATGRKGEWDALLASIRETYRNRPRFMERLNTLDGRTIVQSSRKKRAP